MNGLKPARAERAPTEFGVVHSFEMHGLSGHEQIYALCRQKRKVPRSGDRKSADLLPAIPEGENYLFHTNRGAGVPLFGWRTRFWNFLFKLAKDRPSWTIQARPGPATGPFHWTNRRLSARELCRLQTFPDGLRFDRGRNDVQRML